MATKQVIVMRDKFPDGKGGFRKVRRGKEIAQGSHAAVAFMGRKLQLALNKGFVEFKHGRIIVREMELTQAEFDWFADSFAKVVAKAEDEAQLLEIYEKAKGAGLEAHLITDSGRTEFAEPTKTCVGIGPDLVEKIDPITRDLSLL
jgi:PTH2 family peptidyl-tRNA hydrolase